MTLVSEVEFNSFERAVDHLSDLGEAIDTPFFSSAKTIPGFISEYAQIQLGRRFTGASPRRADLALRFDEAYLHLFYSSTSGTEVELLCDFDADMQVRSVVIKVEIPEDRCLPGRRGYEAITHAAQQYDWYRNIGNSRAVKRGCDRPVGYLPTPIWVFDYISNYAAQDKARVDHAFARHGFKPSQLTGFKFAWKNDCGLIVVQKRNRIEDSFALLKEADESLPDFWLSFRGICEELRLKKSRKWVKPDFNRHESSQNKGDEDYDDENYEDYEGIDLDETE